MIFDRKCVRLADKWSDTTGSTLQIKPTAWAPFLGVQAFFALNTRRMRDEHDFIKG